MPSRAPTTLLALLAVLLSTCPHAVAKPYPREIPFAEIAGSSILRPRSCASPCGWSGQLCCTADQQCTTNQSGQAICGPNAGGSGGGAGGPAQVSAQAQGQGGGAGGAQWQYYTTTWVETGFVTRVSTYSSYLGAASTAPIGGAAATPTSSWAPATTSANCVIPCGMICCAQGQYCAHAGQCAAVVAGGVSSSYLAGVISSPTYSAPVRPTSGTLTTTTSTAGGVTATVPFQTPVGTAGNIIYGTAAAQPASSGGLSTGAIVGIVVGIIILILALIIFFCIRAGRTLFGRRKKVRREETTYVGSHHHRRHGGGGRTWYGGRQSRPPPSGSQRPGGGGLGGFGTVAAGLGALALGLGLKRKHDRRKEEASSYGSGSTVSYETGSYVTSESEFSSFAVKFEVFR
ncbi:MAG: hypothetical protein M1823_001187 [Watsoniomyces obsoletus]|nr:MAG: hypothetical protein M1823_001187 [Watsoniomyces obsoletus]